MTGLLALAFGAGMLSPVNPCGFALLPAYLGYYLGVSDSGRRAGASLGGRLAQGLRAGVVLTLGFAGTLSVLGLAVTAGAGRCLLPPPGLGWWSVPPWPCWARACSPAAPWRCGSPRQSGQSARP